VSLLSALIFGLAPALRAARVDVQSQIKEGHGAAAGLAPWGRRQLTRKALVVVERLSATARFGAFFFGTLWDHYGGVFGRSTAFDAKAPPRNSRWLPNHEKKS